MTDNRVLTSEDRYWAELARKKDRTSLSEVRAVAEKWRSGLTALTGVVTVVLAVGTPFIGARVVDGSTRTTVVVLMVLAVLALGVATWNAMTAAFGVPEQIATGGQALQRWAGEQATAAKRKLCLARWLTLIGFGLLLATAVVGVLGPDAQQNLPSVVDLEDGRSFCGDVASTGDGSAVSIVGRDGTSRTVAVEDLKSLKLRSGCP